VQGVAVRWAGRFWLTHVPDPPSGDVSLRVTVVDRAGDRTGETIYRAYGIS
jgi:hypothetical protein